MLFESLGKFVIEKLTSCVVKITDSNEFNRISELGILAAPVDAVSIDDAGTQLFGKAKKAGRDRRDRDAL